MVCFKEIGQWFWRIFTIFSLSRLTVGYRVCNGTESSTVSSTKPVSEGVIAAIIMILLLATTIAVAVMVGMIFFHRRENKKVDISQ